MSQVEDSWMRPRTKAGTDEMRKRLKAMKFMLKGAATRSVEGRIASKVFNEYFSFDWDCTALPEEKEVNSERKKVALPDRC